MYSLSPSQQAIVCHQESQATGEHTGKVQQTQGSGAHSILSEQKFVTRSHSFGDRRARRRGSEDTAFGHSLKEDGKVHRGAPSVPAAYLWARCLCNVPATCLGRPVGGPSDLTSRVSPAHLCAAVPAQTPCFCTLQCLQEASGPLRAPHTHTSHLLSQQPATCLVYTTCRGRPVGLPSDLTSRVSPAQLCAAIPAQTPCFCTLQCLHETSCPLRAPHTHLAPSFPAACGPDVYAPCPGRPVGGPSDLTSRVPPAQLCAAVSAQTPCFCTLQCLQTLQAPSGRPTHTPRAFSPSCLLVG